MKIEVRRVKSFKGHDGMGFNADLFVDGVQVAEVIDTASGGQYEYFWTNKANGMEKKLEDYAASLPHLPNEFDKKLYPQDLDSVVARLIDEFESVKQLKRWCSTKIVYRLKGDKEGMWTTVKGIWKGAEEAWRKSLKKKYGDKLVEIANEQFA